MSSGVESGVRRAATILAAAALVLTLVATAWLSDDCYFTLRTVENALAGHGLRWNVFERVQAYTHPGWMLVLLGAIGTTGETYLTTIGVSLAVSLAACAVLVSACTPGARLPCVALLLLSRAFVDYSTGGLENPLSHLIAALFLRRLVRGDPGELLVPALLAALAALTRLDTLLLYAPVLAVRSLGVLRARGPARTGGLLALAFAPLVAWELFSFVYYGFLFPNTAYAKLGAGLTGADLVPRGLTYLVDSLRRDPATLPTIVLACVLAARRLRGEAALLALGVALYLAYVVRIGGDFMTGRMLALPLFVSVGLIGRLELPALPAYRALAFAPVLALLVGVKLHRFELLVRRVPPPPYWNGVADERVQYWTRTGLLRPEGRFQREPRSPPPRKYRPGDVLWGWSGMQAYQAPPETIVVERFGLADPLLARLPARFDPDWRVGHLTRVVPLGYAERLLSGDPGALQDADLARYDALLRRVTSGPLMDAERLRIALGFALGRYDALVDVESYRYPLLRRCDLVAAGPGSLKVAGCDGSLAREGARLTSAVRLRANAVEIAVQGGALRVVQLLDGDEVVRELDCSGPPPADGRYALTFPETAMTGLWIQPEPPPPSHELPEEMLLLDVTLSGSAMP